MTAAALAVPGDVGWWHGTSAPGLYHMGRSFDSLDPGFRAKGAIVCGRQHRAESGTLMRQ
jgi:hypothetical protein